MSDRAYPFTTVDVFTDQRFSGNQLAVFTSAEGLSDAEMQALAAEMNYSETTFVLPPRDAANTARVRIFNRLSEMPFAGHPNVGTAYVLAAANPALGDILRFEELAGLVEVRLIRADGRVAGAEIDAPLPLQLLGELPVDEIAACLGIDTAEVVVDRHRPVRASVGIDFVLAEVGGAALSRAAPDMPAFQRTAASRNEDGERLSILAYALDGDVVRARMFAPLAGTWEDPATGSANAALGALRLSLTDADHLAYEVVQGVEMGRPSRLRITAHRRGGEIRASVAGLCVPVFEGQARV